MAASSALAAEALALAAEAAAAEADCWELTAASCAAEKEESR